MARGNGREVTQKESSKSGDVANLVCVSVCLCVSYSLTLYLCVSLSLSFTASHPMSLCLSFSLSFTASHSIFLCLSFSLSFTASHSIFLCLSFSLSFTASHSIFLTQVCYNTALSLSCGVAVRWRGLARSGWRRVAWSLTTYWIFKPKRWQHCRASTVGSGRWTAGTSGRPARILSQVLLKQYLFDTNLICLRPNVPL